MPKFTTSQFIDRPPHPLQFAGSLILVLHATSETNKEKGFVQAKSSKKKKKSGHKIINQIRQHAQNN